MTTTGILIDDFCVGDQVEVDHTITGLLAPITSAELGVKVQFAGEITEAHTLTVTTTPSANGQIISTGILDEATNTFTAEVGFILLGGTSGETYLWFKPGKYTFGYIQVSPGPYTSEIMAFKPKVGGKYG